jgi:positive regulator of sigma E activity
MKDRIAETARVLQKRGRRARVRLEGGGTCRKCGLAALGLCKPGGTGMVFDVLDEKGAEVGDVVRLGLGAGPHAMDYLLAYILPLAGLTAGTFLGWALSLRWGFEWLEAAGGVLGLALCLPLTLRRLRGLDRANRMHIASIVREVPDFEPERAGFSEGRDYMRAFRNA